MKYPKYIYDYPIGEDLFEGKSQEKVATNIVDYLKENSESKKRVVGIDGEWGSGKSNVIEIIKKKTEKDFHIYTFDAWGHQEDLTRRTFLEGLTDDLIRNDLLSSKWSDKLKLKLATNKVTTTQNTPEFNSLLVVLVLLILLSPLIKKVIEYFLVKAIWDFPGLFSSLFTLSFIILVFGLCWIFGSKEGKPTLGKLFFLYKGQQIKTLKHETITSLEPSVREFRRILREIISELKKPQRLVYVFDNMDRLPAKKVKEIWSSIHTFFSEVDTDKLDSWVLIPYDEKHICKVFNDENSQGNELTVSYIQKTFTIVFRIAPPILSDWKKYFENRFKEAFNYLPPSQEQLANLFDYLHDDFTIKPRQIIDYVNNIVALHKQWGDSIPLRYYALFTLTKNEILENPVKVILEKSFIEKVKSLFAGDTHLEKYIASLVFNVDIEKADEVLLRRSIEKTLRGEGSIGKLAVHPAFITVLDSCFYNTQVNIENAINEFNKLPDEIKSSSDFDKYWKQLTIKFTLESLSFPECEPYYKTLFINLSSIDLRIALLKEIIQKIINYEEVEGKKKFIGAPYAEIIDDFIQFFDNSNIDINILEYCPNISFDSEDYISFVNKCSFEFSKYNVICNEDKLNDYLISKLPIEISKYIPFIKKTKEAFNYTPIVTKVEIILKSLTISTADYQKSIYNLFEIYKTLSADKPFKAKIPTDQAWAILSADFNQNNAYDLAFSILSDDSQRPTYIANPSLTKMLKKVDKLEYVASIAEYFMTFEAFIKLALSNPLPLILDLVRYLTHNKVGRSTMNIGDVIPLYDSIKAKLFKEDEEYKKAFLKRLNGWSKFYPMVFENRNFEEVVSVELVKDCSFVENEFTKLTTEKANEYVINSENASWKEAFKNSETSYLFKLTIGLISTNSNSFNKLSENASNAYRETIVDFAKINTVPGNIEQWDTILDYLDARKLKIPYKEIRDVFIYSADSVNVETMIFLEKGLFKYGGLLEKDKVSDVVRKIIIPCILEQSSFDDVICRNEENVVEIIKLSEEHKEDVFDAFIAMKNEENLDNLKYFSESLGFSLVEEVLENEEEKENNQ